MGTLCHFDPFGEAQGKLREKSHVVAFNRSVKSLPFASEHSRSSFSPVAGETQRGQERAVAGNRQ